MELDAKDGQMERSMMENGRMDKLKDKEYLHILILMSIMDSFKETEQTGTEYTFIKMVKDMKAIGKMTFRRVREKKFQKMDQYTKDNLKVERNGDSVLINGQINQNFKEIG